MADTRIRIDIGDTGTVLQNLNKYLQTTASELAKIGTMATTFNKGGEVISQTVKAQITDFTNLTVNLKKTKDGLEAVNSTISDNITALNRQKQVLAEVQAATDRIDFRKAFNTLSDTEINKAQNQLKKLGETLSTVTKGGAGAGVANQIIDDLKAKDTLRKQADAANQNLKTTFPVPPDASLTTLKQYDKLLEDITKSIKNQKLSVDELNRALAGTTSNARLEALKKLSAGPSQVPTQFRNQVESFFPVPSNATANQIIAYNQGLNRVEQTLQRTGISAQRATELLRAVGSGQNIPNLSIDERNIVSGLSRVKNAFVDVRNTTDSVILRFNQAARSAQFLAVKKGANFVIEGIKESIGDAKDLQVSISEIRGISQDANNTSKEWADSLTRVSNSLGIDQAKVATAAYNALSNQTTKNVKDTESFLLTAGELARVTKSQLPNATELLSTALNAYGDGVSKAEERSAQFFKIVELGRVSVDQLVTGFGRVAPAAAQLGVSLPEVGSIIALLTQKGVSPDTALTQTLNLLSKLTKPTEETAALVKGLGYESVQTAISGGRFVQFLGELEKKAAGSTTEIAKLFNEIRGRSAFIGITQKPLSEELIPILDQIKNPGQSFDIAKALRADTAADNLIKEFNRVKNYFTNDFGNSIINTADNIFGRNGGLSGIIIGTLETTTSVVKGASGGLVIYAGAAVLASAKNLLLASSTTAASGSMAALTGTAATATVSVNKLIIGFGAGFFIGDMIAKWADNTHLLDGRIKSARQSSGNFIKDFETARKAAVNQQNNQTAAQIDSTIAAIQPRFAEALIGVNNQLDAVRGNIANTASDIDVTFADYTRNVRLNIDEISKGVTEARGAIQNLSRDTLNYNEASARTLLNFRQRFATPGQNLNINRQERDRLIQENQRLVVEGTPAALQRLEKNYLELQKLADDFYSKQVQINVEAQKKLPSTFDERFNAALKGQTQVERVVPVDDSPLAQELKKDAEDRARQLQQFKTKLETVAERGEDIILDKENRLKQLSVRLQEIKKKADELTKGDNLRQELVDPKTGKLDEGKAKQLVDSLFDLKKFNELRNDPNGSKLFEQIEIQKTNILEEQELIRQKIKQEAAQVDVTRLADTLKRNSSETVNKREEIRSDIFNDKDGKFQETLNTLKLLRGAKFDDLSKTLAFRSRLDDLVRQGAGVTQSQFSDPEKLIKFQEAYDKLLSSIRQNTNKGNLANIIGDGQTLDTALQSLQNLNFVNPLKQFQELGERAKFIEQEIEQLRSSEDVFNGIISRPAQEAISPLQQVELELTNIRSIMEDIKNLGPIAPIKGLSPTGSLDVDSNVGFADDGMMPGTDTNLVWKSRDEAIMNSEATRQFRPLLQAMNNRKMWGNSGNQSSISIGDVNISGAGKSGSVIGADFIGFIKRAQRLGQL